MTTAYPLAWPVGWPRAKSRKSAKFSKGERRVSAHNPQYVYLDKRALTIAEAMGRVLAELSSFDVQHGDAIISTNLALRLDGLPKSTQSEPGDPGVAIYWKKRGDAAMKVMAIDRYDRTADNLAAIAATLNAMRAIERHGGAQILERAFTGFTALPGQRTCWDILGLTQGSAPEEIERRFRELAKKHHPDNGGSADEFIYVQRARADALASC